MIYALRALIVEDSEDDTLLLVAELETAGFAVGQMVGLGPRGINGKGDFTFGRVPGTMIIYMGTARKTDQTGA